MTGGREPDSRRTKPACLARLDAAWRRKGRSGGVGAGGEMGRRCRGEEEEEEENSLPHNRKLVCGFNAAWSAWESEKDFSKAYGSMAS